MPANDRIYLELVEGMRYRVNICPLLHVNRLVNLVNNVIYQDIKGLYPKVVSWQKPVQNLF